MRLKEIDSFKETGLAYLPACLSPQRASKLYLDSKVLPGRRVGCGDSAISWEEKSVPLDHPLSRLFLEKEPVLELIESCIGRQPVITDFICWVSVYRQGEFISPHRDRVGDIQIILSIKAAHNASGGNLHIRTLTGDLVVLRLQPGDMVIFKAHELEHFTTPLDGTGDYKNPIRAIAVGRYFFD